MKNSYKLDIVNKVKSFRPGTADFKRFFRKTISVIQEAKKACKSPEGGEILLIFVRDAEIRQLNLQYRGKNEPTDVISLSYLEEKSFPGKEDLAGEIFISPDTAAKQARSAGRTLRQEVAVLFVHGLLHIFGFDHETPAQRKRMSAFQRKIIR
jgi:probable rRNA maturation factor